MINKEQFSIFLCNLAVLKKNKYIIKFFDELKDEIICFLDKEKNIKVFSSICPHFGGEIFYDQKKDLLRCKWHNWKFCNKTGKCLSYPLKLGLNPYDFEIKPDKLKEYNTNLENDKIFLIYERE